MRTLVAFLALLLAAALAGCGGQPSVAPWSVRVTTPASVRPGEKATVTAETAPGARCTRNGGSPMRADATSGSVTWAWTTAASAPPGREKETIACAHGGREKRAFTALTTLPWTARLTSPRGYVALTYDDGPFCSPNRTPKLLTELKAWNVEATFFVTGLHVGKCPQVVRREIAEGHAVGNHTWDHPFLTKVPLDEVDRQLRSTNKALADIGIHATLWRPPHGDHDDRIDAVARRQGLTLAVYGLDPWDWYGPHGWTPEQERSGGYDEDWQGSAARRLCPVPVGGGNGGAGRPSPIVGKAEPGIIILMHDWNPGTVDALGCIVTGLRQMGLEPGRILPAATPSALNAGSYARVVR